jgi:uncharacterized cupin superfamily protein
MGGCCEANKGVEKLGAVQLTKAVQAFEVEAHVGRTSPLPSSQKGALSPQEQLGPYESRNLGDIFGLGQFGVMMETLPPGSRSSLRHWHTKSDEFVLILEGELTLVIDAEESNLTKGMVVGFQAGVSKAHQLVNRSSKDATFVVVGGRVEGDVVHYPHDDFQWATDALGRPYAARKDGSAY